MSTYISLIKYTQQGIQNIKESPARFDAAKKAIQSMGADIKQVFLTMGQYDLVIIAEAPDDETMAKFILATGSLGNVSTQTMRAFTEDEFRKIVAGLP
ncbi:MAG: GYD domain-containing protein [Anaerolineae bacterium]|nr:GYD domain-containing protein [Anaerolineae bacterium]